MVFAGELALADILLDGRFEIGVGRGHAWLCEPANLLMKESAERYAECLDIIEKGLTEERFSYHGKHYRVDDLRVVPRPLQRPRPRMFQVGTSAKWFRHAARHGNGCVLGAPVPDRVFHEPARRYRELCSEEGTTPYLGWMKAIYLAEDESRAREEARDSVMRFIEFNVSPLRSLARSTEQEKQVLREAGYGFYAADDLAALAELTYEQLIEEGIVHVGAPETVRDRLRGLQADVDFDELCVITHFGGMSREEAMRTQRLFARDIMPALRTAD